MDSRQDRFLRQIFSVASGFHRSFPCIDLHEGRKPWRHLQSLRTPYLAFPLRGRLRIPGEGLEIAPGGLLWASSAGVDVEGLLDESSGEFGAVGVFVPMNVWQAAQCLASKRGERGAQSSLALPFGRDVLLDSLLRWSESLQSGHIPLACHALVGVLLRLHEAGDIDLFVAPRLSLSERIREIVSEKPSYEWSSAEIESAFSLSGATFRRRLAAEGTSFRRILLETRLAGAMEMLRTTRLPVKTVARQVGYRSVPGFSKRFIERYGVEPSRIQKA